MNPISREKLFKQLSNIDKQLSEAVSLVAESTDDDVMLRRATTELRDLQRALRRIVKLLGKP